MFRPCNTSSNDRRRSGDVGPCAASLAPTPRSLLLRLPKHNRGARELSVMTNRNPQRFDPDALLAALPSREVRAFGPDVVIRAAKRPAIAKESALFDRGAYNGFTDRERYRTANLSNWLAKIGSTLRPTTCDICRAPARDEHAENYYDLTSWIGLCPRCHRTALHGRFARPDRWLALLDKCQLPDHHWSRLVSNTPYDLAALLRSRGWQEPMKSDYAESTQ